MGPAAGTLQLLTPGKPTCHLPATFPPPSRHLGVFLGKGSPVPPAPGLAAGVHKQATTALASGPQARHRGHGWVGKGRVWRQGSWAPAPPLAGQEAAG